MTYFGFCLKQSWRWLGLHFATHINNNSLGICCFSYPDSWNNPFVIDPTLAERCFCKSHTDIPPKIHIVYIFPNPSKGLFYIEIKDYKGPIIMKISTASGKLLETHHLMYSGLMSWSLGNGIWQVTLEMSNKTKFTNFIIIQ